MILQAASRYYERLVDQQVAEIAPFGYSPEKISFEILLYPDGSVAQVNDIRTTSGKKPSPRLITVPQPEKKTSGIRSNFLWDKTAYVLGVSNTSKRAGQEHEAFRELHETVLAEDDDPGLKALLSFLRSWSPERFESGGFPPEIVDANVVFRLDGDQQYLHDRPAAQAARARLLAGDGQDGVTVSGVCLVTGEAGTLARLHPAIKGVWDAQPAGASIVSFNLDAFKSYGKEQGYNAPVSEQAAFAYTSALNYVLRRGEDNRQRLQIGDTTMVFWAEATDAEQAARAEDLLADMLSPPPDDASETARLRVILQGVAKGRPMSELSPGLDGSTRLFVLGLAPNISRLSVRFWQAGTLEVFARRLADHYEDLLLEPLPWRTAPSAYRLVLATVPHRSGAKPKMDDGFFNIVGETLRAILSGGLYPRSLLANTIMRFRADGNISGLRVALCKGILARERRRGVRTSDEEVPVSLDKQSTQSGYLLGRLFAVLEQAQRAALGGQINATIRDRYYGAASATPAAIFPVLLRSTQNHIGKLRKEWPGQAVNLEKDIREIVGGLSEEFPRSLKIEDQGRFAIGYYHQSQTYYTRRETHDDTPAEDLAS